MKVCLVGSAPSSVKLQPYNDPSWRIWACSPGSTPHLKRVDAFFELHRWEPNQPWFPLDYRHFLANLQCPVYMIDRIPEIPRSLPYPKDKMLEDYGPFFFTSTLSWMFALALENGATEIALAGIDMSAQEEWAFQRSGCHFFIHIARERGVKVTVPPESDLMRPPPLYGFREVDPMHIKLLTRDKELSDAIKSAETRLQQVRDELMFYKGAYDNNLYQLKTWISDPLATNLAYQNPEVKPGEMVPAPAPEAPQAHQAQPLEPPKKRTYKARKGTASKKATAKRKPPKKQLVNGEDHASHH